MDLSTMSCRSTFKTPILCQLSASRCFQSYLKLGKCYALRHQSELKTIAFRAICSFYFFHLGFHQVTYTISSYLWFCHNVRSFRSAKFNIFFLRWVHHLLHSISSQLAELTTVALRSTKILLAVVVDIPVDSSFQSYQNRVNYKN